MENKYYMKYLTTGFDDLNWLTMCVIMPAEIIIKIFNQTLCKARTKHGLYFAQRGDKLPLKEAPRTTKKVN